VGKVPSRRHRGDHLDQERQDCEAFISECLTPVLLLLVAALPPQVVARQSAEVDYVSGATQSTNAFYYAVINALKKAK
jgi:hypothetical protein